MATAKKAASKRVTAKKVTAKKANGRTTKSKAKLRGELTIPEGLVVDMSRFSARDMGLVQRQLGIKAEAVTEIPEAELTALFVWLAWVKIDPLVTYDQVLDLPFTTITAVTVEGMAMDPTRAAS